MSDAALHEPARISAVGAGRMSRSIALAFAWAGQRIDVVDLKARDPAERAARRQAHEADLRASLAAWIEAGGFAPSAAPVVLSRIGLIEHDDAAAVLAGADVVFEAVTETTAAKQDLFDRLCPLLGSDAILASTTSTILATDLAPMVSDARRFLNAHWLNPAYIVPLVELSPHPGTDPAVCERLRALLASIGKVPVLCAPSPGYIVPRLQALIMNEAARMIEEGVASAEQIDLATRYGLGMRFAALGVVEFIDFGGNDILYHANRYLSRTLSAERYATPKIVADLMHAGRNGLRDGQGFYDWTKRDKPAYMRDCLARTLAQLQQLGLNRGPVI